MKKSFPLLVLYAAFTQNALAGHHPPVEPDDNSGTAFLIGIGIITLVVLIIYFVQKKSK